MKKPFKLGLLELLLNNERPLLMPAVITEMTELLSAEFGYRGLRRMIYNQPAYHITYIFTHIRRRTAQDFTNGGGGGLGVGLEHLESTTLHQGQ